MKSLLAIVENEAEDLGSNFNPVQFLCLMP